MTQASGSYPLGGQSCLWFQGQQMRFGLQQGASGLRHLPSLQYPGVGRFTIFGPYDQGL